MNIAIIQFPGSNCESESLRAVRAAGMEAEEFLWNDAYEKLATFDGYFIVGGFSYEDRSRSGVIASLDPVMKQIREESKKGKPVLGICNGAQILVETGMVPGLKEDDVGMALAVNERIQDGKILGTGFYNAWTHVKLDVPPESSAFSRHMKQGESIKIPFAHGEGRFLIPEPLLDEMKANNLTTFRYCDEQGNTTDEFPTNPNGADFNLAAITNTAGNVMAMMPHPERTPNGQPIFTSMRDYIVEEKTIDCTPLSFEPNEPSVVAYHCPEHAFELAVGLVITDNECETVRKTLEGIGIFAKLTRQAHWEIVISDGDIDETKQRIMHTGELFNSNKETLNKGDMNCDPRCQRVSLLVRYRDDFVGEAKRTTLRQQGIQNIASITKGTLWHIAIERGNIDTLLQHILDSRVLCNHYSQQLYLYGGTKKHG